MEIEQKQSEAARCATAIKKLLKEKYPETIFSVKSKYFSGGNDVTVNWTFGPTYDEIYKLIDDFQDGDFNSMIDLYEYRKNEDNKPRVKYVMATRHYQTAEEIENNKLKWNDPRHRDLYKEEKTFYHIMTHDLCALFGLEPTQPEQQVPEPYKVMANQVKCYVCWSDVINALLRNTPLMTGYHGVKLKKWEDGTDIKNVAEVF